MLQYVLVRRMSQGNLTKQQLISCLYKRSHYRDQQQIVGPYLDFIYTLIKKTKFQESIHNTEIQDFNSKVCGFFFFFLVRIVDFTVRCKTFWKRMGVEMDEDRKQRRKMRLQKQPVHFLLDGQKKVALKCYLNSRPVHLYASMRVFLPAPALSTALM